MLDSRPSEKVVGSCEGASGPSTIVGDALHQTCRYDAWLQGRPPAQATQPPLPRNCEEMSRFSRAMRVWGDRVPSPATGLDAFASDVRLPTTTPARTPTLPVSLTGAAAAAAGRAA